MERRRVLVTFDNDPQRRRFYYVMCIKGYSVRRYHYDKEDEVYPEYDVDQEVEEKCEDTATAYNADKVTSCHQNNAVTEVIGGRRCRICQVRAEEEVSYWNHKKRVEIQKREG